MHLVCNENIIIQAHKNIYYYFNTIKYLIQLFIDPTRVYIC